MVARRIRQTLSGFAASLLLVALSQGCASGPPPASPELAHGAVGDPLDEGSPAYAASHAPAAQEPATANATNTAALIEAVLARMRLEADHRPGGTPPVEAVMRALVDGGVPCLPGQQSLAALTEADYCWQSRTIDGALAFSICEYTTDEAVLKSQEISLTKFAEMGERTFVVKGHTMVTIKVRKPEGAPVVERIQAIVAAMPEEV